MCRTISEQLKSQASEFCVNEQFIRMFYVGHKNNYNSREYSWLG